jgi:co-chaperonin GroES (HSP10)
VLQEVRRADPEGVDMRVVEELGAFMRDSLTWRLLICPQQPRKQSAGGIALPEDVQDAEMHLQYIGKVIAIGPLAGKNEKFLPPEFRDVNLALRSQRERLPYAWPYQVGDWVMYGRYAGMKMEHQGIKLLVVNDDELLGRIPTPEGFKVYA